MDINTPTSFDGLVDKLQAVVTTVSTKTTRKKGRPQNAIKELQDLSSVPVDNVIKYLYYQSLPKVLGTTSDLLICLDEQLPFLPLTDMSTTGRRTCSLAVITLLGIVCFFESSVSSCAKAHDILRDHDYEELTSMVLVLNEAQTPLLRNPLDIAHLIL
jgi:hypothetical protein